MVAELTGLVAFRVLVFVLVPKVLRRCSRRFQLPEQMHHRGILRLAQLAGS